MEAGTADFKSSGWVSLPLLISGIHKDLVLQWRTVSIPPSTDGSLVVVSSYWPVPFPTMSFTIMQALTNSMIYSSNGTLFTSSALVNNSMFNVACSYKHSTSTVTVWGIGY